MDRHMAPFAESWVIKRTIKKRRERTELSIELCPCRIALIGDKNYFPFCGSKSMSTIRGQKAKNMNVGRLFASAIDERQKRSKDD